MPVPAPSQLPPFLSAALRDKIYDEAGGVFSPLPSPTTATTNTNAGSSSVKSNDILEPSSLSRGDMMIPTTPTRSTAALTTQQRSNSNNNSNWAAHNTDSSHLLSSSSSSLLVPPLNFDMINSGGGSGAIYRSGHPNERNFLFMSTLNLKSIIYLSSDDVRDNLQGWIDGTHGTVKLLHFRLNVNKEPFAEMDEQIVAESLHAILDRRNLPTLIHCNKGKYRVGVITALIRRLQGWSMTSIFDEYARFAGLDRVADEEFIDMFPLHTVKPNVHYTPDWITLSHQPQ